MKIKNIMFDFGGILFEVTKDEAVRRFQEIGFKDVSQYLGVTHHAALFADVENGKMTAEAFCEELSKHCGHQVSFDEAQYCWMGFRGEMIQEKFDYIDKLREKYRLCIVSNINPFVMKWAYSDKFTPSGRSIRDYFDDVYCSYDLGYCKPDPGFFEQVLSLSGVNPAESLYIDDGEKNIEMGASFGFKTLLVANGSDWRSDMDRKLME